MMARKDILINFFFFFMNVQTKIPPVWRYTWLKKMSTKENKEHRTGLRGPIMICAAMVSTPYVNIGT